MVFSALYNGPIVILSLFWVFFKKREWRNRQFLRLLLDAVILVIAVARFRGLPIPASGHAVFLTHTLITVANRYYRLVAAVFLIFTVASKVSWGDYESWIYGILAGLATGAVWIWVGRSE